MKITFRDHCKALCTIEHASKKTIEFGTPAVIYSRVNNRWTPSKADGNTMVYNSIVLRQEHVKKILPALIRFAETGQLMGA